MTDCCINGAIASPVQAEQPARKSRLGRLLREIAAPALRLHRYRVLRNTMFYDALSRSGRCKDL